MDIKQAVKLHKGDEVTLKDTKEVVKVVDVDILTLEDKKTVNVMLNNGVWYSHKDIL